MFIIYKVTIIKYNKYFIIKKNVLNLNECTVLMMNKKKKEVKAKKQNGKVKEVKVKQSKRE